MRAMKRIMAIICVFMLATAASASAQYSLEQYDEDFVYEQESIAMALSTTTVYITNYQEGQVECELLSFNSSKFTKDALELINEMTEEGKSAEVILDEMIDFSTDKLGDYLSRNGLVYQGTYNPTSNGSGVVISEDGYIATNNHVIDGNDETIMETLDNALNNQIQELLSTIITTESSVISTYVAELSEEYLTELQEQVENILSNFFFTNAEFTVTSNTITVYYAGADGDGTKSDARSYSAELVNTYSEEERTAEDATPKDVAILKIDASSMVALDLADDYPAVGSTIWAMGYPDTALNDSTSQMQGTLTTGPISALRDSEASSYKLIQTDATISHGNSGGPSVNNKLKIVGLNTYSYTGSGVNSATAYYDVPAEAVSDLIAASGVSVGAGDLSKTFLLGIQALQQGYGLTALECFEAVKAENSDTPYIDTYIEQAQKAEQTEMPQPQHGFFDNLSKRTLIIIIGAGALVLIIIVVVIILLLTRKKKTPVRTTANLGVDWSNPGGDFGQPTEILPGSTSNDPNDGDGLL